MRPLHVEPPAADRAIARFIADNAMPQFERISQVLTWAADEHVLYAVSAGLWLGCLRGGPRQRASADHILACVLATNILAASYEGFHRPGAP